MQRMNRRRLLCLALGAAGAAGLGWYGRSSAHSRLREASRTGRALGTETTITALHVSHARAERAVNAAFDELERVEWLLSIYRPESQVSRLNRHGRLADPHEHLLTVLDHAQRISWRSGGAFDVTVQPLWNLFHQAQSRGALPDEAAIATARQLVDFRSLDVSRNEIRLRRQNAAITLNGIAQGYAADRVAAVLAEHGVEHALVNAGEMVPLGKSTDGDQWTVGIQHPRQGDAYAAIVRLDGRALATSGDYATTFSDDFRFHHLFDPRTGISPTELASVSVVAPTAMAADALSTALFVLGPARGLDLIGQTPGADAFLVLKDGRTRATGGFPLVADGGTA